VTRLEQLRLEEWEKGFAALCAVLERGQAVNMYRKAVRPYRGRGDCPNGGFKVRLVNGTLMWWTPCRDCLGWERCERPENLQRFESPELEALGHIQTLEQFRGVGCMFAPE
jgi:hypothetical protein